MGGGSHAAAKRLRDRPDSRLHRNDDKGRKTTERMRPLIGALYCSTSATLQGAFTPAYDSVIPAQAGTPTPNSSLPPSRREVRWGVGVTTLRSVCEIARIPVCAAMTTKGRKMMERVQEWRSRRARGQSPPRADARGG